MNNLQIENIVNVVTRFVQYIDDIYCEIIIKSICKKGKKQNLQIHMYDNCISVHIYIENFIK